MQRSLLRFAEDGIHQRIGTTASSARGLSVALIFATNVPIDSGDLAPDLVARLQVIHVPPLAERRADLPAIFLAALSKAARPRGMPPAELIAHVDADHAGALCLGEHPGGVRHRRSRGEPD